MDAEKNKKLQQYATILADQAKEAEQSNKPEDAVKHYLKLVDVFLVLATEAPDHNSWTQYIHQAEMYQTKIRSLVPKEQVGQDISARIPPPPSERPSTVPTGTLRRPETQVTQGNQSQLGGNNPAGKSGSISKFFKPFQGGKPEGTSPDDFSSSLLPQRQAIQQSTTSLPNAQPQSASSNPQRQQQPVAEERTPVPREVYERMVSENKILHERLQTVMKESDEKTSYLESRNRELEERVAMMVSRSEYDQLRAEFENMVPRHEYDRVKTELSNTVPITHYDQLLDRIANMVPREIYMASERRNLELEDRLRHSVPLAVIDDIANEVSYVSILAEVPPIIGDIPQGGDKVDEKSTENEPVLKLVKSKSLED